MKVAVEVPDAIYRQVKARAALQGRSIRDVTIELYERWLASDSDHPEIDRSAEAADWLRRWDRLGAEMDRLAADPRSAVEIVLDDRS